MPALSTNALGRAMVEEGDLRAAPEQVATPAGRAVDRVTAEIQAAAGLVVDLTAAQE